MRTLLEQQDIEAIASRVADRLEPKLRAVKHEDEDILMNIKEVAKYLRCSVGCIYKLTSTKAIPHFKRGEKFLLFRKSHIDKWINSFVVPVINSPVSLPKKVRSST